VSQSDPSPQADAELRRGVLAATAAYLVWGLFPLYIKLLVTVPSVQVLAHRGLWCALLVWGVLVLRGDSGWWRTAPRRTLRGLTVTALLISINWGVYIWGVNNGHVIETSLGYFITPLVSVLFGVWVLGERLDRWQWIAVVSAVIGVLVLTIDSGRPPWIALALAVSFGSYGLARKRLAVEALQGLAFESGLLLLPSMFYLLWSELQGNGAFLHGDATISALLVLAGLATAVPLTLFTYAARRIPLVTLGVLQYIAPALQLLLGVFVFHEPFGAHRALAFGFVLFALAIYSVEGVISRSIRLQR
jgi:chloramphenicol-sensitive protein RarD